MAILTALFVTKLRDVFWSFTHRKVCYKSTALRVTELFMKKDMRRASNKNACIGHKSAKKCLITQWQENWTICKQHAICLPWGDRSPPIAGALHTHLKGSGQWQKYFQQQLPSKHRIIRSGKDVLQSSSPSCCSKRGYRSRLSCSCVNPKVLKIPKDINHTDSLCTCFTAWLTSWEWHFPYTQSELLISVYACSFLSSCHSQLWRANLHLITATTSASFRRPFPSSNSYCLNADDLLHRLCQAVPLMPTAGEFQSRPWSLANLQSL